MNSKLIPLFRLNKKETLILEKCDVLSSLAELTRTTSLPRSTVEYILHKLMDAKLVHIHHVGKRVKYSSISQNQVVQNVLQATSPIAKTYTNTREITLLWETIAALPKNTRIVALQPYNSFKELARKIPPDTVARINKIMTDKKFIFEAIIHANMTQPFFDSHPMDLAKIAALSFTQRLEDIVKIPKDFLNEKAEIFIVHSRLIFIDWYSESAVEINNQHITNLVHALFATVKEYGKRFNHGEAIEKSILLAAK